MPDDVTQDLIAELDRGRDALRRALAGLDPSLAGRRPAPDQWSILECVEHVALVEQYLLSRLACASAAPEPQARPEREAKIRERAVDRTRRIPAPDVAIPRGAFPDVAAALAAFDEARDGTKAFLLNFRGDLRAALTDHPIIPGPVNGYEVLLMMALHPARHAAQIAGIRAAAAATDTP